MSKYSDYWNNFYKKKIIPDYPSNFAKYCLKNFIKKNYNLLEIGTGNGRDAIYFSKYLAALSYNLATLMPGDLNKTFLCNSGAEAVEGALKISYKYYKGTQKNIIY